ncbi:hypothetical protein [Streptomyces sp. NBC_01306]|uniref:hypothetical protein n=1 Tax=Streptomyces sp. NBC_01306 TaxID=2903819 RepID=UPI002B1D6CBF|nr:hypothetical protein [Streptomyces sp. NBC_01306]
MVPVRASLEVDRPAEQGPQTNGDFFMLRRITTALAAGALLAGIGLASSGTASAAPAGGPWVGCPYGAVCIYGQDANPWGSPHPTDVYYSYGAHNLSGKYGHHYIVNNQYNGASVSLCSGYNGVGCHPQLPAQNAQTYDLTPVNSITLNRDPILG